MMIDDIWSAVQRIIKQSPSPELGLHKLLASSAGALRQRSSEVSIIFTVSTFSGFITVIVTYLK